MGLALRILLAGLLAGEVAPNVSTVPLGLLPVIWPPDNPYSDAKWELGRSLFFDQRLSLDESVSCATCHNPQFAFTDTGRTSSGIHGQSGTRSAPTILNRAFSRLQFWDGRAGSLEEQAIAPIENPVEMGHSRAGVVERLQSIPGYRRMFAAAFGSEQITIEGVVQAIATFERTALSGNSPYDRYMAGDKSAMTAAQIRGWNVFVNKAKCDQCHEGIDLTTNQFHNVGVGMDKARPDLGRFTVTHDPKDWGAFRTPTLREVARTAPYMHDGSLATLEDVVEYYDRGGNASRNLDETMKPLHLSEQDKKDLVEFLKALSGEGWQSLTAPKVFPE